MVSARLPYLVGMAAWALLKFAHGPSLPISADTCIWTQYVAWHAWPASIKWAARRSLVTYRHAGKRRTVGTREEHDPLNDQSRSQCAATILGVELQRLEARVVNIAASVFAGSKVEDDRVELKRIWPADIYKTARQIAGHANASRGEPILWIIGLDEDNRTVVDSDDAELANWWPQVRRRFDGEAPDLTVLSVQVGVGQRVTALRFDTSRAPYVVSTENGGRVEREVPWRVGNSTRTAHRHELLASLVAEATVPELEVVSGRIVLDFREVDRNTAGPPPERAHEVRLEAIAFLSAADDVFLPQHRQSWLISAPGIEDIPLWASVTGSYRLGGYTDSGIPRRDQIDNIEVHAQSGMAVHSSGEITVRCTQKLDDATIRALHNTPVLTLTATLPIDRSARSAVLTAEFSHVIGSEQPVPNEWDRRRTLAVFEAHPNG